MFPHKDTSGHIVQSPIIFQIPEQSYPFACLPSPQPSTPHIHEDRPEERPGHALEATHLHFTKEFRSPLYTEEGPEYKPQDLLVPSDAWRQTRFWKGWGSPYPGVRVRDCCTGTRLTG